MYKNTNLQPRWKRAVILLSNAVFSNDYIFHGLSFVLHFGEAPYFLWELLHYYICVLHMCMYVCIDI